MALRKAFPDVEMTKTMRQRAAKYFYVAEYPRVLRFLENYWKSKIIEGWNPNA